MQEYDKVVTEEYGKCDHLTVPRWMLDSFKDKEVFFLSVLDLGCGTGRRDKLNNFYIVVLKPQNNPFGAVGISSQLFFESTHPKCSVTGVDLTPAMCAEAKKTRPFQEAPSCPSLHFRKKLVLAVTCSL